MSLPKEPRQKMINIMYLVLTALLALNVSSEILNAFKTVNNSLEKTNKAVNLSSSQIFASLTDKLIDPATKPKAEIWQPRAKLVMDYSTTAYDFIQGLKDDILRAAGGDPKDPTVKFKEDNLDIATRMLIKDGKGKQLLKILGEYKKNVFGNDTIRTEFEKSLQVDLEIPKSQTGAKRRSWEETYFHMVPTVAALTILSKFQNDVKTSENKVVTFCHEQVGKVILRFDAFEAIVGQNSNYLMPGQEIEITAGLGAFSKQKVPDVFVGGTKVPLNEKGMAIYKTAAGGIGEHTLEVTVSFTDQDGQAQTRKILAAGAVPLMFGGDDSTPIPFIAGFSGSPPLTILQIDAHIDWRDDRYGEKFGFSSTMRRASEQPHVWRIVQAGARGLGSAREAEVRDAKQWGARIFTSRHIHHNGLKDVLETIPRDSGCLITLDCDALDTSEMPAVAHPSPGGLTYMQVIDLIAGVAAKARIAGFTMVEFAPKKDRDGAFAYTAARIAANVIGHIARQI